MPHCHPEPAEGCLIVIMRALARNNLRKRNAVLSSRAGGAGVGICDIRLGRFLSLCRSFEMTGRVVLKSRRRDLPETIVTPKGKSPS